MKKVGLKFIKKWKGVVSFCMALLILFYSVFIHWDIKEHEVYAEGAQDRVETFISMAAGKQMNSESINNLTLDELRFLGIYLSNFYIPFFSELGIYDEASIDSQKERMIKAISNNLKYDEQIAGVLVDNIIDLSRNNYEELILATSENYHDGNYTVQYNGKPISYDLFLQSMVAGYTTPFAGQFKYGYFGYMKDGKFTPVFDFLGSTDNQNNVTACQAVFRQCAGAASLSNGYGTSLFDFTAKEASNMKDISKIFKEDTFDSNAIWENSIFNTTIAVDCFGDIIMLGPNHQYIMVPGCMNPYTWSTVNSNGVDTSFGDKINIISVNEMALADAEKLWKKGSDTGSVGFNKNSRSIQVYQKNFANPLNTNIQDWLNDNGKNADKDNLLGFKANSKNISNGTGYVYRLTRGSSVTPPKSTLWKKLKTNNDAIFYALEVGNASDPNWGYDVNGVWSHWYDFSPHSLVENVSDDMDDTPLNRILNATKNGEKWWQKAGAAINEYWNVGADYIALAKNLHDQVQEDLSKTIYTERYPSSTIRADYQSILNQTSNEIGILDNMIYMDNLGAYGFNDDTETDMSTFNFVPYLNDEGKSSKKLMNTYSIDKKNAFTSKKGNARYGASKNKKNSGDFNNITMDEVTTVMMYTTYAVAGLYKDDEESKKNTIGKLGFRVNIEELPTIANSALKIPTEVQEDLMKKTIQNWIYYLLHPSEGMDYVKLLVKNKLNAILVGWHNDMLGTNGVGATTGVSYYKSNTGYVTTPDLSEIQWTSSLIDFYNTLIPFLIIIMLIIMLFSYISGIMPLQKSVFGLILFSLFLFTPVSLINNVVGTSNNISQRIYGEKFTYWALVQQESYSKAIDEAANGDSYDNYLRTLYEKNSEIYTNQGNNSIVLKWQAPKKMASLMFTSSKSKGVMDGLKNTKLVRRMLGKSMSGETYLNGDSDYMYRSYIDLSNFSRYVYRGISSSKVGTSSVVSVYDSVNADGDMLSKLNNIKATYKEDIDSGYTNPGSGDLTDSSKTVRLTVPFGSVLYKNAVNQETVDLKGLGNNDYVGLHQCLFNFSIPMFNKKGVNANTLTEFNMPNDTAKSEVESILATLGSDSNKNKELTSLAAYGLISESPFYYYSWCLYDQGMITDSNAAGNYKNLLLGQDNGGYFYNNIGNGELKDFMDMRSLFTYIIPYLKQGNDVVREWDDLYGVSIYDGVPTDEGHWNDPDITNNEELKQKYWHNLNVARLYEIYTPWVDLMYDCPYAKQETITVMGEKYVIQDPINPASYPDERPMIFSESEMYDYGLTEADLTEVERRVLKCNRGMEERMYELLNYYSFSDVTLNTAAAMSCTFEFNTVFSSNGILSDNINLYPQSFEISDFSFDAFLRLILANTLGEDLIAGVNDGGSTDFYTTVVNKSSPTTAFMYILVDMASQYALPACKIFFIMAVFISSILLIIATAFKVDPEQRFINKLIRGIATPMGGLLLINIGFSWVISLFMGVGNNAVTQSNVLTIETGDPVITMLIIFALDAICILLYYKLIRGVIDDIKHNFKLSKAFVGGAIGGSISVVGKFASQLRGDAKGSSGVGSAGGTNYAEEGTGRQSVRASRRASENMAEGRSEEGSTRINDSKRETFKQSTSKKSKSTKEQKDKINNTIKSGSDNLQVDSNRAKDVVDRQNSNVVKDSGKNAK